MKRMRRLSSLFIGDWIKMDKKIWKIVDIENDTWIYPRVTLQSFVDSSRFMEVNDNGIKVEWLKEFSLEIVK